MIRSSVVIGLSLALIFAQGVPLVAATRMKNEPRRDSELKAIVPFAVPVGVPVATLAPYFYSYQQFVSGSFPTEMSATGTASALREPPRNTGTASGTQAHQAAPTAPPRAQALGRSSLEFPETTRISSIAKHCAACHSGAAPKAGLSLEPIDTLSDADRLNAIRAVVAGRMPKSERLSPEQQRAVIDEITR